MMTIKKQKESRGRKLFSFVRGEKAGKVPVKKFVWVSYNGDMSIDPVDLVKSKEMYEKIVKACKAPPVEDSEKHVG